MYLQVVRAESGLWLKRKEAWKCKADSDIQYRTSPHAACSGLLVREQAASNHGRFSCMSVNVAEGVES